MFRNGELLSVGGRAGYLWRLPTAAFAGVGAAATAGIGLGGVSAGAGPMAMFRCIHAIGCMNVSVDAKAFRPAFLSPWTRSGRFGAEFTLGLYVFKATAAVYRDFADRTTSFSLGAGVQLLF